MKNRLNKIKAFTLSEMIVVLLITTIVVGMAFAVLNLVQQQMQGIQNNYEKNTGLNLLRQSLWIDFNQFEYARYDSKNGVLHFSNEIDNNTYRLEEELIIKERDTFRIKWESQTFYFENTEQSNGRIDALDFRTTKEYGGRQVFVYRNNSANTYMNQ